MPNEFRDSGESNGDIKHTKELKKENNKFSVLNSTARLRRENNLEKNNSEVSEHAKAPVLEFLALMRQLETAHRSEHLQLSDQLPRTDTGDWQAIHSSNEAETGDRRLNGPSRNFEDYQRKLLRSRL